MFFSFNRNDLNAHSEPFCYVRILNAAHGAQALSIKINDEHTHKELDFPSFTNYSKALPGCYNIKASCTGEGARPQIDEDIMLEAGKIYTLAISGDGDALRLRIIPDSKKQINQNAAGIRFVNLSADVSPVDTYINKTNIISDLDYEEITNYVPIAPGAYTFGTYRAGADGPLLALPEVSIKGGGFYTFYQIGGGAGEPSLKGLIPVEGCSFLML